MRRCRSCGSLILGEVDACGRCGAPLPLVGAAVAAPAPAPATPAAPVAKPFGRLNIPPPGGRPAAPIGGAPAPVPAPGAPPAWSAPPPPPSPFAREAWQPTPVVTAPARRAPRTTRLGVALLAVVLVVVGVVGVTHLRSDAIPAGTSAFVAGNGVPYTSPDGTFQVQLPQTPTLDRRQLDVPDSGLTGTLSTAIVSTDQYEIGAGSIVLPVEIPTARVREALDAALSKGVSGINGKIVSKDFVARDTLPAIEGRFKAPDGYSAHILVVYSHTALVLLIVHAKTGTERLYKALEQSLVVA